MSNSVFVLQEPDDLFCHHFFPTPEAAHQWAKTTYHAYPFFLITGDYGEMLVNPIYVVELTQP